MFRAVKPPSPPAGNRFGRGDWLLLAVAVAGLSLAACDARSAEDGVIFVYHRVGETTPASTSVRPDEFAAQMRFLESEDFTVLPLLELIESLEAGDPVPERSVAITFDDAYDSVLSAALPELESRGWPFTVFVNTQAIDDGYPAYLSWDELRTLGARGASIGNHSVSHGHLADRPADETEVDWRRRVNREITAARVRLEAELGDYLIPVFAYPYGEYTSEIKAIVAAQGLYGLGQQSGAVGRGSDFLALPRYPIAAGLGLSAGDFALRARSRALPARPAGEERHIAAAGEERPPLRLALEADDDVRVAELACYASGQGRMALEWLDEGMTEFEIRPEQPLAVGRSKYNCTAPSRTESGVWYWYSYLWMRRRQDGDWYDG